MEELGSTGPRLTSSTPLITCAATLVKPDEGPTSEEMRELRELVSRLEAKLQQQDEAIHHFQQALNEISSETREARASLLNDSTGPNEDHRRTCWRAIVGLICICKRKDSRVEEEMPLQYHEPGQADADEVGVSPVDVTVEPQDIILDHEYAAWVCDNQMREPTSVLPVAGMHEQKRPEISTTMSYDDPTDEKERLKRHSEEILELTSCESRETVACRSIARLETIGDSAMSSKAKVSGARSPFSISAIPSSSDRKIVHPRRLESSDSKSSSSFSDKERDKKKVKILPEPRTMNEESFRKLTLGNEPVEDTPSVKARQQRMHPLLVARRCLSLQSFSGTPLKTKPSRRHHERYQRIELEHSKRKIMIVLNQKLLEREETSRRLRDALQSVQSVATLS